MEFASLRARDIGRRVAAAAVGAGLLVVAVPSSSLASAKCSAKGPLTTHLADAFKRQHGSVPALSHERTGNGLPQRTTYLGEGSYVVTACMANGDVHEEQYQLLPSEGGNVVRRLTDVAEVKPNGRFAALNVVYGTPATMSQRELADARANWGKTSTRVNSPKATAARRELAAARAKWSKSATFARAKTIAKKTSVSSAAPKAMDLRPGKRSLLFKRQSVAPRARTAQFYGNKCWHNEWVQSGSRPGGHYGFFTAFGGGWPNAAIGYAAGTWTNVYSSCNFSPNPGVTATAFGDIPNMAIQPDGYSHVGWGWGGSVCGPATDAIGCHYGWGYQSGGVWVYTDSDITFDVYQPWAFGAVSGHYDLWTTAAHEFGHAYGLGHTYSVWASEQVMHPTIYIGTSINEMLGLGDFNGLSFIY